MGRKTSPPSSNGARQRTTFGCSSFTTSAASWTKRFRAFASRARCGLGTLIAYSPGSISCVARYTTPLPPRPISAWSVHSRTRRGSPGSARGGGVFVGAASPRSTRVSATGVAPSCRVFFFPPPDPTQAGAEAELHLGRRLRVGLVGQRRRERGQRARELRGRGPALGIEGQHRREHRGELEVDPAHALLDRNAGDVRRVHRDEVGGRRGVVCGQAGEHPVQRGAERVDVARRGDLLAARLLGRHVARRPHRGPLLGEEGEERWPVGREQLREAEVADLHVVVRAAAGGEEHVPRLDVAVHDVVTVRLAERARDLGGDAARAHRRQHVLLVGADPRDFAPRRAP